MSNRWQVLRVAIHIHSDLDDGDEDLARIIELADESDIDALLVTYHNWSHGDHMHGWETDTHPVVMIGTEVETRHGEHILAFGIKQRIASERMSVKETLSLLEKLGTTIFVAHPEGWPWKFFFPRRHAWQDWDAPQYHGVEIWSYMHDWIDQCTPWHLPAMCRDPHDYITGPRPEILAAWDKQAQSRRVAGIGALDAHGRQLPLGLGNLLPWARDGILPYRTLFETHSTCVLVPEGNYDAQARRLHILDALTSARCWVCHDHWGSGREFRFITHVNGTEYPVGSELPFAPGIRLHVHAPQPCTLAILNRGEVVATTGGTNLTHIPATPGEYRAAAHIDGRPWIFTNHVYVRERTK